jgi:hypothetical protein
MARRSQHLRQRHHQVALPISAIANLKAKGFALEATHLTYPDKLCTLLAPLVFAVTLTAKIGVAMAHLHLISFKKWRAARRRCLLSVFTRSAKSLAPQVRSNNRLSRAIPFPKIPRQTLAVFWPFDSESNNMGRPLNRLRSV